jgi:predicted nuclease of predicted toxin-antitoxin system
MFGLCRRPRKETPTSVMKLLFDQNISYRIVKKVSDKFSGCLHVSSCGLNDAEDSDI